MLLSLSILGIFLSILILYYNAAQNRSVVYLSGFFFLLSFYGLYEYVLLYSKSIAFISVFLFYFPFITSLLYLIGPLLYLYVRSILTDNANLRRGDAWHLLPLAIFFVAALPYSIVPLAEKVAIAAMVVEDTAIMHTYKTTFLAELFSITAIYLSRPLLVLAYTVASGVLVVKYHRKKEHSSVFSHQSFVADWMVLLLGSLMMLVISHILLVAKFFIYGETDFLQTLTVLQFLSIAGLAVILVSPLFYPSILYGMPRVPKSHLAGRSRESRMEREPLAQPVLKDSQPLVRDLAGRGVIPKMKAGTETSAEDQRKNHDRFPEELRKSFSHYETGYLQYIGRKAESFMKEQQPYLQPDFNLNCLSVQIGIPVHHLGYYFREVREQTFSDYRNEWRVKHAKQLMQEGMRSTLTLEAIGLLSGFANRNAFCNIFKKVEGYSPSEYDAQLRSRISVTGKAPVHNLLEMTNKSN